MSATNQDIAIVGLGLHFPGAHNEEEYFQRLQEAKDLAEIVPPDRWGIEPSDYLDPEGKKDKVRTLRGYFLHDLPIVEDLDPQLDPVFHLALDTARQTIRSVKDLHGERAGLIMAAIALPTDTTSSLTEETLGNQFVYDLASKMATPLEPLSESSTISNKIKACNNSPVGLPAQLVAHKLGLALGGYTIDAACASSLVAIELACQELRSGRAQTMLAGGLSRPSCLYTQMGFSALHALSPSGVCSPFDERADGLMVGEGCGLVVLKRLETALEDGDEIYAVIKATGLSNDIEGSLVAPSSEGQLRSLHEAYKLADLKPWDIDLIECHGTGTPVGDKIELNSLKQLWQEAPSDKKCQLRSVKSMIGHLLTAAGASGLIRVLLNLKHEVITPQVNFHSHLESEHFEILSQPKAWPKGLQPRRAAVSGFGFGGINAHLILQDYTVAPQTSIKDKLIGEEESVAIIGIACHLGNCQNWPEFAQAILNGDKITAEIDNFQLPIGKFRIPPMDIPKILTQQSLLLDVAAQAMEDADLPLRQRRERAAAYVGITLDLDSTNFNLRWKLQEKGKIWAQRLGLDPQEAYQWLESLKEEISPALDATRTIGALGSIAASRVARELQFGGCSFAVSAQELSGFNSLQIAVDALLSKRQDLALVGTIDLQNDPRYAENHLNEYSAYADNACCLVLKRFSEAQRDGNHIYAVIKGLAQDDNLAQSLQSASSRANVDATKISYLECDPQTDLEDLRPILDEGNLPLCIGNIENVAAHCGASNFLASLLKTIICLDQEFWPATGPLKTSDLTDTRFVTSPHSVYWFRNRADGPRTAAVCAEAYPQQYSAVILQGCDSTNYRCHVHLQNKVNIWVNLASSPAELKLRLQKLRDELRNNQLDPCQWYKEQKEAPLALVIVEDLSVASNLAEDIEAALQHLEEAPQNDLYTSTIFYTPNPLASKGKTAFVYPGSGANFLGLGREFALSFPEIMHNLDSENLYTAGEFAAQYNQPFRFSWSEGWKREALENLTSDTHHMMSSQVSFGMLTTDILRHLGLDPQAAIGYSLGESSALFSLRAWPERDKMYLRMEGSDLFRRQLSGPCLAARQAWHLAEGEEFTWQAGVIPLSSEVVKEAIAQVPQTRLLIVNTDSECVVGGTAQSLDKLCKLLKSKIIKVSGVDTVHCDLLGPVRDRYWQMHYLPCHPLEGVDFYSGHKHCSYPLTSENIADSIASHGLYGFDYTKTIRQAWNDGVRIFLELGPGSSCTRMIKRILADKPHYAISLSQKGRSESLTLAQLLAGAFSQGLRPNLPPHFGQIEREIDNLPSEKSVEEPAEAVQVNTAVTIPDTAANIQNLLINLAQNSQINHSQWLNFVNYSSQAIESLLTNQARLLQSLSCLNLPVADELPSNGATYTHKLNDVEMTTEGGYICGYKPNLAPPGQKVFLDRQGCLQFATGKIGEVLGEKFALIDNYSTRVRLPAEPLMLVDRILEVEGEPLSLGSGRVVTEHDVVKGMWYLDGNRAPVFISVEAGQADLFLCSYLGIDLKAKGERVYRLLDANVVFHRGLPQPGETIHYDIRIKRFINQGDTWLFFFEYEGTINGEIFLTMRNGCAGFFTYQEIANNGGLILTEEALRPKKGLKDPQLVDFVPLSASSYSLEQVDALRCGDLVSCFGSDFAGLNLRKPVSLPTGLLRLIHSIPQCDPYGGRWGLGEVIAEAAVHPDDWYLTCHFVDDMVMPGTLMYECCSQALRFLLTRLGWVGEADEIAYEPVVGVKAILKCRGPVLQTTKMVRYQVEIKEMGYNPAPYVIADAIMFADGKRVVGFENVSMQLTGTNREKLERLWSSRTGDRRENDPANLQFADGRLGIKPDWQAPKNIFNEENFRQFAVGKPSLAFGPEFADFDNKYIARLPGIPYQFVNRIISSEHPFLQTAPGGWTEAQYDVPPNAWYFKANKNGHMPFCVLNEIALQVCGWVSSYAGSSLHSNEPLKYRNLGGTSTLYREITPQDGRLTIRVRLTKSSEAGGLIVQSFDMWLGKDIETLYEGKTTFGFFTQKALDEQVGVRNYQQNFWLPQEEAEEEKLSITHPLTPFDDTSEQSHTLSLPGKALLMLDDYQWYPQGGLKGLGAVVAHKAIDPQEWFFTAHFFGDPVMPGSLGLEAFLQALKIAALKIWPDLMDTHHFSAILSGEPHTWLYRGQVVRPNSRTTVRVNITQRERGERIYLKADGFLQADDLVIYELRDFAVELIPNS